MGFPFKQEFSVSITKCRIVNPDILSKVKQIGGDVDG